MRVRSGRGSDIDVPDSLARALRHHGNHYRWVAEGMPAIPAPRIDRDGSIEIPDRVNEGDQIIQALFNNFSNDGGVDLLITLDEYIPESRHRVQALG